MRKALFSFFLFFFFAHFSISAEFTIVLKNGKKIDGTLVSDSGDSFQIKDKDGILLSIKKDTVDLHQTVIPNRSEATDRPLKVGQLAKVRSNSQRPTQDQSASRRHVYTKADLEKMYGPLSTPSSEDYSGIEHEAEPRTNQNTVSSSRSSMVKFGTTLYEGRTEADWHSEGAKLFMASEKSRFEYLRLAAICEESKEFTSRQNDSWLNDPVALQNILQGAIACRDSEKAMVMLLESEAETKAFQERARQAGVPPGIYESDRLFDTGLGMGRIER